MIHCAGIDIDYPEQMCNWTDGQLITRLNLRVLLATRIMSGHSNHGMLITESISSKSKFICIAVIGHRQVIFARTEPRLSALWLVVSFIIFSLIFSFILISPAWISFFLLRCRKPNAICFLGRPISAHLLCGFPR